MTAVLAGPDTPDDIRARGRGLIVEAEDRAHDLAIVAAHRAVDLTLADKLYSELVDHPEVPAPRLADDGPTGAWIRHQARQDRLALERGERALTPEEQRRMHRRSVRNAYRDARIDLSDIDTVAVIELAAGRLPWDRSTYPERVLAVEHCRVVLDLSLKETARRLDLNRRTVIQMRRHARILREGVGQ